MLKRIIGTIIVLALVTLYLIAWFTNPARHHLRFRDTHFNTHLVVPAEASFQHYLTVSQEKIKLARAQGGVNNTDEVVMQNAPFELLPDEKLCKKTPDNKFENGILLIHGFLDSAYSMHYLGNFFRQKCFVVYVILLPGHGTVPGDLSHVSDVDWVNATHFGVNKLQAQAKNIYLLGHSLGGILAINEVSQNPTAFKALILLAPSIQLKTSYSFLVGPAYWVSQFFPRLKWLSLHSDDNNVKYESYPLNPVYQIVKLIAKVQHDLSFRPLDLPVFIEQSADDMTVDPLANLDFFEKNHQAASKLLWYSENNAEKNLADSRIKFIFGAVPSMKILDMSHLSYSLPATDPIYGRHGSYHDCLYYTEHSSRWQQCETGDDNYLGEITEENVKLHLVQRLTFNPFEDIFLSELSVFIDALK